MIFYVLVTFGKGTLGSYSATFFPTSYSLQNYKLLFTDFSAFNFPKMLFNTFIIAAANCLISTFIVISVAYTLSRMRFKGRKKLMNAAMIVHLLAGVYNKVVWWFCGSSSNHYNSDCNYVLLYAKVLC